MSQQFLLPQPLVLNQLSLLCVLNGGLLSLELQVPLLLFQLQLDIPIIMELLVGVHTHSEKDLLELEPQKRVVRLLFEPQRLAVVDVNCELVGETIAQTHNRSRHFAFNYFFVFFPLGAGANS